MKGVHQNFKFKAHIHLVSFAHVRRASGRGAAPGVVRADAEKRCLRGGHAWHKYFVPANLEPNRVCNPQEITSVTHMF
jgi:hypothetical protein